jgi:hypothetical protein
MERLCPFQLWSKADLQQLGTDQNRKIKVLETEQRGECFDSFKLLPSPKDERAEHIPQ